MAENVAILRADPDALERRVLEMLALFLQTASLGDLTPDTFAAWAQTLHHLTPTVRRNRLRIVRNFCLYRRRTDPTCFVPDLALFPARHQPRAAYIFTPHQIAQLVRAAATLPPTPRCPLRPDVFRLAVVLLYTTGLRRGELLRLTVGDYASDEQVLLIRETKFHKSRQVPLALATARDVDRYLRARRHRHLSLAGTAPLLGHGSTGLRPYTGVGLGTGFRQLLAATGIRTPDGQWPRIHDLRHTFASWAVQRRVSLLELKDILGHSSLAMVQRYAHLERDGRMPWSEACGIAIKVAEAAKRYIMHPPVKKLIDIPRMASIAQTMLRDALDAFVRRDLAMAQAVLNEDDRLDSLKTQIFRELLTYMLQDPSTIEPALDLILISRHLERIGDHVTNIAESVHFLVTGRRLTETRSKGDTTSSAVLGADDVLVGSVQKMDTGLQVDVRVMSVERKVSTFAKRYTCSFRSIRLNLTYAYGAAGPILITVSSPGAGDGKSFVARNLAIAFARSGHRTLLVDGDLRKSRLHVPMGAPHAPGLAEYLRGDLDEYSVIQQSPEPNLFFIPGGEPPNNPAELLGNGRFQQLLERAAGVFDWIIVDTPPTVPVADASLLARLVDGVLFVVRAGFTPYDLAQKACDEFRDKHLVGYFFLDDDQAWQPDAELRAFLEDGPPPVMFTFGSMMSLDPRRETGIVLEAIREVEKEFDAARDRLAACGFFESVGYQYKPSADGSGFNATFEVKEVEQSYPVKFDRLPKPDKELLAVLEKSDPLFGERVPGTAVLLAKYAKVLEGVVGEKVVGKVTAEGPNDLRIVFQPAKLPPSIAEVKFLKNEVLPQATLQKAISGTAVGAVWEEKRFRQILDASIRPLYEARGRLRIDFPKVTVEPAGTRISLGVKDQMPATIRTSYRPGPTSTTPGRSKGGVAASSAGSTRPSSPGGGIPAPKAVTMSAASIPTGMAMLGRIQASSYR